MGKKRLVHFVGGPLHGESREVPDGKDQYTITRAAAGALGAAIRGEEGPSEPAPTEDLTYIRRRDGRYYLEIGTPDGVKDPPKNFSARWFDSGDGMVLLEFHGPESDWGHPWEDMTILPEFLADLVANQNGAVFYELSIKGLEDREREMVRHLDPEAIEQLAVSILGGTAKAKSLGNRRLVAAMLREYNLSRSREG